MSITSPCILPIIPLYLAYLMGTQDRTTDSRSKMMVNATAFVVGFSIVFVLVGTAFGLLGTMMAERKTLLVQLGGLLMITLGLHQIGVIRLPFLSRSVSLASSNPNRREVQSSRRDLLA